MPVEVALFILAVAVLFGTAISILVSTLRTGSPPMPSGPALRRKVVAMIAAADIPDGVIYDLGSGWGGLARAVARAHPGRDVVGLEGSFVPCCVSRIGRAIFGPSTLRFRRADFTRADLSDAAVAVCYLSGDTLRRVAPDLERRLPPGCVIVSAMFAWPGRDPAAVERAGDLFRSPVYLYRLGQGPADR